MLLLFFVKKDYDVFLYYYYNVPLKKQLFLEGKYNNLFIILNENFLEPIYVPQTTTYLRVADENACICCWMCNCPSNMFWSSISRVALALKDGYIIIELALVIPYFSTSLSLEYRFGKLYN